MHLDWVPEEEDTLLNSHLASCVHCRDLGSIDRSDVAGLVVDIGDGAGLVACGGRSRCHLLILGETGPLIIAKEEKLILDNGTTQVAAKDVADQLAGNVRLAI